ncbi:MAG: phosphoribosylamine--glycine ligase [Enterobacteriaceae bacterium]
MRILVIGRGGREHALVSALALSPGTSALFCVPGNDGIAQIAQCTAIDELDFTAQIAFCKERAIDLVVVGPDAPLVEGIVDALQEAGIVAYGPSKLAARIEGSKRFMKELLTRHQIPTARYAAFDSYDTALAYMQQQPLPLVIKADGLAAGKGVIIAHSYPEAEQALQAMLQEGQFGSAGAQVVIEEFLQGEEISLLSFVDGLTVRPMLPVQDHKTLLEGDQGPNTGGMGTYAPLPHIPDAIIEEAVSKVIKPTAAALAEEDTPFRGILFAGLMVTAQGVKAIEFNARFGDPETQVLLPLLQSDLLQIILASLHGKLAQAEIRWRAQSALCVVLSAQGYPQQPRRGDVITGIEEVEEMPHCRLYHAGTAYHNGEWQTYGGRILNIVGLGEDLSAARTHAYQAVEKVHFAGRHYRQDIGYRALST